MTVGGGHQRAGGKPGAPRKGLASNHVKRRPQESSQPAQGQSRPSTRGQYQTCRAFDVCAVSAHREGTDVRDARGRRRGVGGDTGDRC